MRMVLQSLCLIGHIGAMFTTVGVKFKMSDGSSNTQGAVRNCIN